MKNLLYNLILIVFTCLSFTFIFALSFRVPLFSGMDVYFYRAVLLIITTLLIFCALLSLIYWKKCFSYSLATYLLALGIAFCMNFSYMSLITVALDRSISVFILAYMDENRGQSFSKEQIDQIFNDVYMDKYKAMDRRFAEQIVTGSIVETESGYTITPKGSGLLKLFRYTADLFPVDSRFLYPEKVGGDPEE